MPIYHYYVGLEVGKPYMPGRTRWPQHVEYDGFWRNSHMLRMFLPSLTPLEIRDVAEGDAEFGLYLEGDVILFLYRFGSSFPWSDAPYSWHLVKPQDREVPGPHPLPLDPRDPLYVVLVEADNGIVRVVRQLQLSAEFTREVRRAIAAQAGRPWPGDAAYDRQLQGLYRRYPRPDDLLARAKARTVGAAW